MSKLKTKIEIQGWLDQYSIRNCVINEDLTVDKKGYLRIQRRRTVRLSGSAFEVEDHGDLHELPINFGRIDEAVEFKNIGLTSLSGSPYHVKGSFNCSGNRITSLEGAPTTIGGTVDLSKNEIQSLEHFPKEYSGLVDLSNNRIRSIDHELLPEVAYSLANNPLVSLRGLPRRVDTLWAHDTQLMDLEGCPEIDSHLIVNNSPLNKLKGCPKRIPGKLLAHNTLLTSIVDGPEEVGDGSTFPKQIKELEHYTALDENNVVVTGIEYKVAREKAIFSAGISEGKASKRPRNKI